jgi:autotransporter-associated beta strand protein
MNAKRLGRMAGCFGCLLTGALNAEVVWTGAVNGTWDTSTPNWRDGASEAVFAPGADARFDDSALSTDVSISGNVSAGTVVFDNVGINYLLKDGGISAATEFVKRGSGTLRITGKNHAFTGDMLVEGGELIADVNNDVMNATSEIGRAHV